MARGDWRERDDERRGWRGDPAAREDFGQADYSQDFDYDPRERRGYRADPGADRPDDYGQADYSSDWAYDAERGRPYRRFSEDDRDSASEQVEGRDRLRRHEARSWLDRAGDFLSGGPRRRGPSDRVLWAIIAERLEHDRRLDLSDVELIVRDGEATLNGTVRNRAEKRRIEDVADMDEVRHVQNNLRVRNRGRWTFL
jgi:hypothetical protein